MGIIQESIQQKEIKYYSTIYEFHTSLGEEKFKQLFGKEGLIKKKKIIKENMYHFLVRIKL